jgi:PilZ domain-containing protein
MLQRREQPRLMLRGSEGVLHGSFPVTIVDVSLGGLGLEARSGIRPGGAYELIADLEGRHVQARLLVTRCRACGTAPDGSGGRSMVYRAGASFVHIEEADLDRLREVVGAGDAVEAGTRSVSP